MRPAVVPILAPLCLALGCAERADGPATGARSAESLGSSTPASSLPAASTSAPGASPPSECARRVAALASATALPGAPGFEAQRAQLLGRAKGEAVLFTRVPAEADDLDPQLSYLRARMAKGSAYVTVPQALAAVRYFPDKARRLFLREGYLYAESPELAAVLVEVLRVGHFFKEQEALILRGAAVLRVRRDKTGVFRHVDGELAGDEAMLLFGDRLGLTEAELLPPLHRDLAPLGDGDAPDRVTITRLTERGAAATARWGDLTVPVALDDDGRQLTLGCVDDPSGSTRALRDAARARATALTAVRRAVRQMVKEKLRFDEPLKEVGQQDGSLRPLWRWSYDHGGDGYSFNGVGYAVFDVDGRPQPPQVCVDFVLDAYERASGTWYGGRAGDRARTKGGIDFDATDLKNRRSAAELTKFALAHPESFEVWSPADDQRVPFGRRAEFFAAVTAHADRLRPGDIVVIHGFKSDGQVHYHSFLVDAKDPLTGVPHKLAGNAGRPRVQTWEGVMRSAPLRSIKHVLSPRTEWLTASLPR